MKRGRKGFTLVEVMISLVILALVMSAVSTFFIGSIRQFKVQSRIAQTGMDSLIGIELLRKDVEHAGYGIPWNNIPTYQDAVSGILSDSSVAPRGIVSVNGGGLNGSDYLVVKAANVGMNDACRKWTTLRAGGVNGVKRPWTTVPAGADNLEDNDRVIVLAPGSAGMNWRSLVVPAGWSTTFNDTASFAPGTPADTRVIYGIDNGAGLRMPFNRADYFVSTANVPQRCAPNTGVLVKSVVRHTDGTLDTELPLLDCVASMQVQFDLDTDGDGAVDPLSGYENDLAGLTAAQIRDQVKQIRITLLAHEGEYDKDYTHSVTGYSMGDAPLLDLKNNGAFLSKGLNFRWKVYTLSVTPQDLGG